MTNTNTLRLVNGACLNSSNSTDAKKERKSFIDADCAESSALLSLIRAATLADSLTPQEIGQALREVDYAVYGVRASLSAINNAAQPPFIDQDTIATALHSQDFTLQAICSAVTALAQALTGEGE